MQEKITKRSSILGRDAEFTKTVSFFTEFSPFVEVEFFVIMI